jgi:hypothetical protein
MQDRIPQVWWLWRYQIKKPVMQQMDWWMIDNRRATLPDASNRKNQGRDFYILGLTSCPDAQRVFEHSLKFWKLWPSPGPTRESNELVMGIEKHGRPPSLSAENAFPLELSKILSGANF